jgi:uncharacterized DUF497 family protein
MRCIWDEHKNRLNQAKHKLSFETATLVFDDPLHVSVPDQHEYGEARWQTVGLASGVVLLLVVHTLVEADGEEVVRIISARKATKHERIRYEQSYRATSR